MGRFVLESIAGHEALGEQHRAKGCKQVLAGVIRLDSKAGQGVVTDDHEEDKDENEELEITGQQRDDKTSDEDMSNVEHQT